LVRLLGRSFSAVLKSERTPAQPGLS